MTEIYCFTSCALFGMAAFFAYDILNAFLCGSFLKNALKTVLFSIIAFLAYLPFAVYNDLTLFRGYMLLALLLGGIIYCKTLRIALDFLMKKVYNIKKVKLRGKNDAR